MKIALTGNPNCGKTTLFNELTGLKQYIGNWPGVTVEKKEGRLGGKKDVIVTDLPGIYSLSPFSPEEVVTRDFLLNEKPDVILNVVDGTNLERNLFLTTELLELGIPLVLALNMADVVEKSGSIIDTRKLSESLGCDVVTVSALKGTGIKEATDKAIKAGQAKKRPRRTPIFHTEVETALSKIHAVIEKGEDSPSNRFYSTKLFERDSKLWEQYPLLEKEQAELETIISKVEQKAGKGSSALMTSERYDYIAAVVKGCLSGNAYGVTLSDKIDRIVTNRFLAIPIFVLSMFLLYFISITTLGSFLTGFVNDVFFGEWIIPGVGNLLAQLNVADWLQSLVLNGIIGGVGSVLGFVPQIFILFFLLSVLEDCGYMTRVAFIMDRFFRKIGLSGKSFIPMLIASGCGVPGILAAKTIENEKDRRLTIMTATFIPCSAKLPAIALIGGAMFPHIVWMAPAMYFVGVLAVIFSGIVLNKSRLFAGESMPFIMELPGYHIPSLKSLLIHTWERGKAFIIKAGTVIFLACAVIWFLTNFGISGGQFAATSESDSFLAAFGKFVAPVFAPLGFGFWQASIATISGLIAKENVVGTLSVLLGAAVDGGKILDAISGLFHSQASALSFLVFNLLCAPCIAAISAIFREMPSKKWAFFALGYQTLLAYAAAFILYQIGGLFMGVSFGIGTIFAVILLIVMLYLLLRPAKRIQRNSL